jgi:acyl-CoA thioester hydrolase
VASAPTRAGFRRFLAIPTRWMDNDSYGHVNNVVYYSYFDTIVNEHLIEAGHDVQNAPVIGVVVETCCRFHYPLSFPGIVDAGLRVARVGKSSVRYEIGLFDASRDDAAADGHFVHVWVERATNRPSTVPAPIRDALAPLVARR